MKSNIVCASVCINTSIIFVTLWLNDLKRIFLVVVEVENLLLEETCRNGKVVVLIYCMNYIEPLINCAWIFINFPVQTATPQFTCCCRF